MPAPSWAETQPRLLGAVSVMLPIEKTKRPSAAAVHAVMMVIRGPAKWLATIWKPFPKA